MHATQNFEWFIKPAIYLKYLYSHPFYNKLWIAPNLLKKQRKKYYEASKESVQIVFISD